MEAAFVDLKVVKEVVSGYSGGIVENPSYKQVSRGTTGHRELVQITYDPPQMTYKQLLDVFWRQIDPTDEEGQFSDRALNTLHSHFLS